MKYAINTLQISLKTLETNEPINRLEDNHAQADLESVAASETRQAIAILEAADAGPIWPDPKSLPDTDLNEPHPTRSCATEDGGCESCQ